MADANTNNGGWKQELQNARSRYAESEQAYLDASACLTQMMDRTNRSGIPQTDIAAELGMHRQTVAKRLSKLRNTQTTRPA